MQKLWSELGLQLGSRVLVPLCGKSLDMLWLAEQGHQVVGVELSGIAVRAFFEENNLSYETREVGPFTVFYNGRVEIFCGDYLALEPEHIGEVAAVYDRASLIAFPLEMRVSYAQTMHALVGRSTKTLLLTVSYDASQMDGPPFSVPEAHVRELYGEGFEVDGLVCDEIIDEESKFRERGLTSLLREAFCLTRR